jgi:hypothetical protein
MPSLPVKQSFMVGILMLHGVGSPGRSMHCSGPASVKQGAKRVGHGPQAPELPFIRSSVEIPHATSRNRAASCWPASLHTSPDLSHRVE